MNLRWGVMPFRLDFESDPEQNIDRTFRRAAISVLHMLCQCPSSHLCLPAHNQQ